jgi:hypothetical protein
MGLVSLSSEGTPPLTKGPELLSQASVIVAVQGEFHMVAIGNR